MRIFPDERREMGLVQAINAVTQHDN
jgi:hypothetical protein